MVLTLNKQTNNIMFLNGLQHELELLLIDGSGWIYQCLVVLCCLNLCVCTVQVTIGSHKLAASSSGASGLLRRPATSSASDRRSRSAGSSSMQRAVSLQAKEVPLLAQVPDAARNAATTGWVPC